MKTDNFNTNNINGNGSNSSYVSFYDIFADHLGPHSSHKEIKDSYIKTSSNLFKLLKKSNSRETEEDIRIKIESLKQIYDILSDEKTRNDYNVFLMRNLEEEREEFVSKIKIGHLFEMFIDLNRDIDNLIIKTASKKNVTKDDIKKSQREQIKSLTGVSQKMLLTLSSVHIKAIMPKKGDNFYPELHDATTIFRAKNLKENLPIVKKIIKTEEKGFYFFDMVLKKAGVSIRLENTSPTFKLEDMDLLKHHKIDFSMTMEAPLITNIQLNKPIVEKQSVKFDYSQITNNINSEPKSTSTAPVAPVVAAPVVSSTPEVVKQKPPAETNRDSSNETNNIKEVKDRAVELITNKKEFNNAKNKELKEILLALEKNK